MTEEELMELEEVLSSERINAYIMPGDPSLDTAIERYLWNMRLAEALWSSFHLTEVTLRNRINKTFSEFYGENWLLNPPKELLLSERNLTNLKNVKDRFNAEQDKKKPHLRRALTNNDLVAGVDFGFWTYLFKSKYDPIWNRKGVMQQVFPNMPADSSLELIEIHDILYRIKKLRNRVAHHDPVYDGPYKEVYAEILMLLEFLSPVTLKLLKMTDRIPEISKEIEKLM